VGQHEQQENKELNYGSKRAFSKARVIRLDSPLLFVVSAQFSPIGAGYFRKFAKLYET